jgi:ribonuclease HI
VIHLSRKTEVDPEDVRKRIPLTRPQLSVNGHVIQEVQSYKYLGIQIDAQLRWKEQAQRAVANATKWLLQYRRLTRPSSGTSAKLMRQLYLAVALPKITYGLDVWYTPPNKPVGQTKNSGSVAVLRQLQKTQRIASLAIIGALRTTPNDFADIHAGILPMELALLKANHRSTVRILTLPPSHPLHRIVTTIRERPPTKHASPLANLIKLYDLAETKMETIIPTAQLTLPAPSFTVKISDSRKDSIEQESKDDADYKVFSDGSGFNDGIGAAAILYAKNRITPTSKLKMFLGPSTKHNTYEAELVGAILALWLLRSCPSTVGKRVSLYIDNQAVLSSITNPKATSGQFLSRHLNLLANESASSLGLSWISSHSKVHGNEKVDELAKSAANGVSSSRASLPHLLRHPLPISVSATKQEYHETLKGKWEKKWEDSDRSRRLAPIDDNFPFNSYRKRTYALTRHQASLMTQLRSGHIPLNGYLHKIGKSETEICQNCLDDNNDVRRKETVSHYIFECEAFREDRKQLIKKITRRRFNLKDIMADTDRMRALATFINKTERLKK